MKIKIIYVLLILAMSAVVLFIPEHQKEEMQHENWAGQIDGENGLDENGVLSTHLPIMILHTGGEEIPGLQRTDTKKLTCPYSIINTGTGVNRSDGEPIQSGRLLLSIRGNSSRPFIKKQYALKTIDEEGKAAERKMLDVPAESNWVLNGSIIDPSQFRNYIMYNLAGQIMEYAPQSRLCEVMIEGEDGKLEYQGIYTLIEKPKVSKNRLKLTKYNPAHAQSAYLLQANPHLDHLEIRHLLEGDIFNYSFDLEYPDVKDLTQQTLDYIQDDIFEFEKTLFDAEKSGDWTKVNEMIDIPSFVDYFLLNEFFQNYDAGKRSTYLYKDVGGKFKMGPVWDFDGAFNNFLESEVQIYELRMKQQFYYYYLMKNPYFTEQCVLRYKELRATVFEENYLLRVIDGISDYLGDASLRNCDRWYMGDYESYYDEVEEMKEYVIERGRWLDKNLEKHIIAIDWKGTR